MPDTKQSDLADLTGTQIATGDKIPFVDISDSTMAATGTNKEATVDSFRQAFISGFGAYAKTGRWGGPTIIANGSQANSVTTEARLVAVPWVVCKGGTIDRIGISVDTAGGSGAVVRLGVYEDDGSGYPGALLLDAGTATTTANFTEVNITVSQAVKSMTLYWLVHVAQGGASPVAAIKRIDHTSGNPAPLPMVGFDTQADVGNWNKQVPCFYQASVTGALPSNFTTTVNRTTLTPIISYRWA